MMQLVCKWNSWVDTKFAKVQKWEFLDLPLIIESREKLLVCLEKAKLSMLFWTFPCDSSWKYTVYKSNNGVFFLQIGFM